MKNTKKCPGILLLYCSQHWQYFLVYSLSKAFCTTRPFVKLPVTLQEYPFKKTFSGQVPQKDVQGPFHPKQFNNCEDKIKEKAHFAWLVCPNTSQSCDQNQQYSFSLKYCVTLSMLNSSFPSPPDILYFVCKNKRHRQQPHQNKYLKFLFLPPQVIFPTCKMVETHPFSLSKQSCDNGISQHFCSSQTL